MNRYLPFVYAVIAAADLLANVSMPAMRFVTKPLLVPILFVFFLLETKQITSKIKTTFVLALFFAWLGDCFLLFEGLPSFMLGLGFFLVMQLFYIRIFSPVAMPSKAELLKLSPVFLLCCVTAFFIISKAGELSIPIFCYFLAITTMVLTAALRQNRVGEISYKFVYLGAILFLISDAFIAINKFVFSNSIIDFLVMPTYIVAQYLIVSGIIRELKELPID